MLTNSLDWLGRHARFVLASGCIAAIFLPSLSAALRPALPLLVSLVLGLAIARLDLIDIAKTLISPRELTKSIFLTLLLMPATAIAYFTICRIAGLSTSNEAALIYLAAAPPIASATALCFLLGFNTKLALQTTIVSTTLTPLLGPLTASFLLPEATPISAVLLGQRLGAMIVGGLVLGTAIRLIIGSQRIDRHSRTFDGVAAIAMILFVLPLFDGVGSLILADPQNALWITFLAFVFNFGINFVVSSVARLKTTHSSAGSLGLMWGNRTVAIYLAALPYDPDFSLFVALYQLPMYLTPLIWQRFWPMSDKTFSQQVETGNQQNE